MMNRIIFIITLVFSFSFVHSQEEVEADLQMNTFLIQHSADYPVRKMMAGNDTVNLPFKDDFSYNSFYPDTGLWTDNFVYINRDYPIAPPTLGVATFDGLNASGYPYNFSASQLSSNVADYITSKYIRLGSPLSPVDSLYFSFYYQAAGRGNDPEPLDSLILQFFTPSLGWKNVWGRRGYSPAASDSGFHHVMVPITNSNYFTNAFRFRFVNHATLSGNLDHWHVDYVYLNSARSISDNIQNDVAFVYNAPTFLKNYQQMPWEQYRTSEMKTALSMYIRNNNNNAASVDYIDTLRDATSSSVWDYNGGNCSVNPFVSAGYASCASHENPPVSYSFPLLTDSATFTAEHKLNYSGDVNTANNTLFFDQKFHDYYAYDDGSAESGYGLSANNASFAYKFTLNQQDTLRAFNIFFNPIQTSVTSYSFRFAVWNGNSGTPGSEIKRDSVVYPLYSPRINEFIKYDFDTAHPLVLSAGTYFFGWIQYTTNILNVGLDKNTRAAGQGYYNVGSGWVASTIQGSIMVRPVFGKKIITTSIEEGVFNNPVYTVFPNPANGIVNITGNDNGDAKVSLLDAVGRTVKVEMINGNVTVDISQFTNGIYFLVIEKENTIPFTQKLIISNRY